MSYQSINPFDGKILKTFEQINDKQLESAIATAETCFKTWRHTTFAERAAVAAKAAAIMRARVDEFARPVTLEMGKLIEQARAKSCSARTSSTTTPGTLNVSSHHISSSRVLAKQKSKVSRSAYSSASSLGTFPITSLRALPHPT